jgi:hypothetical protein
MGIFAVVVVVPASITCSVEAAFMGHDADLNTIDGLIVRSKKSVLAGPSVFW